MELETPITLTGKDTYNSWIIDIESNGLNPTKIHCVVLRALDDSSTLWFKDNDEERRLLSDTLACSTCIVGHNIIDYDLYHLRRLWNITVPDSIVVDTLVLSHLLNYQIEDGHSLNAWGVRLGEHKGEYTGDWENYNNEMLEYCIQDTYVNLLLYRFLMERFGTHDFTKAIKVEHEIAFICKDMEVNGFTFDKTKATELLLEIKEKLVQLDTEIKEAFPPRIVPVREITPRLTQHGTISRVNLRKYGADLSMFTAGAPFTEIEWKEFNPASPKEIVKHLNEVGWKPVDKTKGHIEAEKNRDKDKLAKFQTTGWRVNEKNLATLPECAPSGARKLVERILLDSRRSTLDEWLGLYNPTTRSIHGSFRSIGTWTHRMSHQRPNMGNVAANKSIKYQTGYLNDLATSLGGRMRALWITDVDEILVGTDAEGIQLRILAHYLNNKEFTFAVTQGRKEDGTDPHTLNQRALGPICKSRDTAKTFIYAFLLGAGVGKVAEILGCSLAEAREAIDNFIRAYPGLAYLKDEQIPRDAERGYFIGLDGRLVACSSEHLMLAGYLQNGEATVTKHANVLWRKWLKEQDIWYKQVNFVHDEYQTKVKNDLTIAKKVGILQAEAIRQVGIDLNLNCPLSGSYSFGYNWLETH